MNEGSSPTPAGRAAALAVARPASVATLKPRPERRAVPPPTVRAGTVLLAGNDPRTRAPLVETFASAGFQVVEAVDVGEAAARYVDAQPTAVVFDLGRGDAHAYAAFRELRARAAARSTPVLALLAAEDEAAITIATRAGATDLLPKPALPALVLQRVVQTIRVHDLISNWRGNDARRRLVTSALPDTLLIVDAGGTILEVVASGAHGVAIPNAVAGTTLDQLLPSPPDASFADLCAEASIDRESVERELLRQENGGTRVIDFRLVPLDGDQALVVLRDTTERRLTDAHARRLLNYDGLTGLPNRALFMNRLATSLTEGPPRDGSIAVLRLHVDQFSRVDQALGPRAADEFLREIGARLIGLVEAGTPAASADDGDLAMAARLDADAFAMLAIGLGDRSACEELADRVRAALAPPVSIAGRELRTSISVGISVWPSDGADAESLLRNAAAAASDARAGHGARHYSDTLRVRSLRGLDLEQQLRRALEVDELELHYQPKVDMAKASVIGFEALLRWNPLGLGPVSPAEIIPVAEQCGLIMPLGEWVLDRACADLRRFAEAGAPQVAVSVNVSAGQFGAGDLAQTTQTIIERASVVPSRIELELTESVLMRDMSRALRLFSRLREIGCRLSIDDFGTGYSSLQYLRRLPIDALKIDRSFVKDIPGDRSAYAICNAVLALGRSLGLEVIAEGVETAEQAGALLARGCTRMQGYLLSKPMPAAAVPGWLAAADWKAKAARVAALAEHAGRGY